MVQLRAAYTFPLKYSIAVKKLLGRLAIVVIVPGSFSLKETRSYFVPVVPLLGFGNTLWKGVAKAMAEDGVLGIFKGGFTASAVGISGALVFGYLGAIIFRPGMKE